VIFAALIQQDPMLLIGPHGTGKSYLLNRLAASPRLQRRHCNASLLNFDDLVGYPLPNGSGGLDYIQTPASIWGAQSVFIDEISRCRPEVQNKLFSIIHERCVQGLPLRDLVYRWSAMNPPPADDGDSPYAGSEPLDRAPVRVGRCRPAGRGGRGPIPANGRALQGRTGPNIRRTAPTLFQQQ